MKKFSLILFLFFTSCVGFDYMNCFQPSEYTRETAQSYYDTFGTYLVSDKLHNKIKKKFSCYYRAYDKIYAYKTFWGVKYILVRHGKAITYIDEN